MSDEGDKPQVDDKLVAELEALREKNRELLDEAKAAKRELKRYGDIDPEKYQQLIEAHEKAESERAKAAGDWEKREASWQKKVAEKDAIIADQDKRFRQSLIDRDVAAAIAEHGGNPKLLAQNIRSVLAVDDEYGVYAEVEGKRVSAADYVGLLKQDDDYAGAFPGAGISGSGAKGGKPTTTGGLKLPPDIEVIN